MSEPGPGSSRSARGRWRRRLRLTGFVLQLLLCIGLVIWFALSGEILLLTIAVILAVTATWLGLREVRGRPTPPQQTSR